MNAMKKSALVLFLTLGALGLAATVPRALAANWDFVTQGNQNYYYIDAQSIRQEGDHKVAWTLVDHRKIQTLKDGQPYRSTHGQVQVHCKDRRARLVHLRFFSGPMMSGAVVQQQGMLQEWLEIESGSPIQRIAYRVC